MTYETIKRFKKRCPSVISRSCIFTVLKADATSLFSLCHMLYDMFGDGYFTGDLIPGVYFAIHCETSSSLIPGYDCDAVIVLQNRSFVQLFKIDD